MRPSRVFRLLFRIFILILSLSITIVAFLGGLSALIILGNFQRNIGVNPDNADFNIEVNTTTYEVEDISFALPFYVNNTGYFDLENLEITISLDINYSHVNFTTPGVNTSRQVEIYYRQQNFGTIRKGATEYFNFTGDMTYFDTTLLPNFTSEVDWYRGPPAIEFYVDIIIGLDYSIGLHSVTIGITNLKVGEI